MRFIKYITSIIKKLCNNVRVTISKLTSAIIESARTISYVETNSNKADTLHRHVKSNSENDLKRAFEFNTRDVISRMGLGRVTLAFDTTKELYYGKNGGRNARGIKYDRGTDRAFEYLVLSVVSPRPLPLMAIPYKQGDDITKLVIELLEYARTLRITIGCVLFDRNFYIGALINYLSSEKIKYLIFVPQNSVMKRFIGQTEDIESFNHKIKYYKNKEGWIADTKIVVIKGRYYSNKKKKWIDCYWCFATNLRQSLHLIVRYKQRWQIETDFRVHDEARIKSKSNEMIVRYFYFLTSLILMANWQVNRIKNPEICFKKYLKNIQLIHESMDDT